SERGNITGKDRAVLVESTPVQMLGLDKSGLNPAAVESSARRVAEKAKIDPDAFVAKAHAAGAEEFVDAVPVRQEDLPADFLAIPGAALRTVTMPAPRSSGYARALLGTIGYATPEQAKEAGINVTPGDLVGVSGLQRTYDAQLRGSTGNRVFLAERDAPLGTGEPTNDTLLADFPDVPGDALETTIDEDIQTAAEEQLRNVQVPASVVVLEAETGAILAAADSPNARLKDDSTMAQLAPGLAASPVSALALMRSGVDLDDDVECVREVVVAGRTYENDKNYRGRTGEVTLERAIATGCTTAIAATSARLDAAKVPEAAKTLGLGAPLDVGVPIAMGDFPAPANEAAKVEALTGFGAGGGWRASALALATMAASVEAGQTVSPFVVPEREPKVEGAAPLTEDETKALQDLMKAGAATYRPLTGATSGTSGGRTWAVGYTGDYAVAVVMADSTRGSLTPAQLVRTVASAAR
ncbi:MAG: penicillin-binding transpeptidase domain-containing protein, partial [Propionibacteriaceae bacterium]|nr:penicillin-binding transpeptidase domain-containing protein [Propionibacteriaceae bacterium]